MGVCMGTLAPGGVAVPTRFFSTAERPRSGSGDPDPPVPPPSSALPSDDFPPTADAIAMPTSPAPPVAPPADTRIEEGEEPKERPGSKGRQREEGGAPQHIGEAAVVAGPGSGRTSRGRTRSPGQGTDGQAQDRDNHEFAQDQGRQGIDQPTAPM